MDLEKIGYYDAMDTAELVTEFEELLHKVTLKEAEELYYNCWKDNKE